jgi:malonate transporter and related proteins
VVIDVLQGFAVIAAVITAGFLVAKARIVPEQTQEVLGKLAFYVFTPSLLLTVLARADWTVLFSQLLPVLFVSSITMIALAVVVWGVILRRGVETTIFAALGAGYVNANNIGLPVAAYILGDPALSAPIILFQVVLISPIVLAILDVSTGKKTGSRMTPFFRPLKNPMIIASVLGAFLSWQNIDLPPIVLEPFSLLGQAAVPVLLVLLGWSMAGHNPLAESPHRKDVIAITVLKLVVMPVIAWALAVYWIGLEGPALFAVVVLAALPTAQNVFTYAVRYATNVALARDSVMVTTLASVVAFIAITLVLV